MNCQTMEGQVAIVTGASRGIGRSIALELAEHGAIVIVNYKSSQSEALEIVGQIEDKGGVAEAIYADVTNETDVKQLINQVHETYKRIDVLVCNAGIVRDQLLATMKTSDWDLVLDVNLRSVFLCIREVTPYMMRQKYGSIVNISSIAAERGGRGHANYVAAKGGVNALTYSMAIELAKKNIRVNAVSPGVISTDMTRRVRAFGEKEIMQQIPLKRIGDAEEVAKAVRFLASADASYITGEILHVTGGFGV